MEFHELRLAEPIVRAVTAEGYTTPTRIQTKAIPAARAGASGVAFSFCDHEELDDLRAIERLIKDSLEIAEDEPDLLFPAPVIERGRSGRQGPSRSSDEAPRRRRRRSRSRGSRRIAV